MGYVAHQIRKIEGRDKSKILILGYVKQGLPSKTPKNATI